METEFALSQAVGSGDAFEHGPAEVGHRIQDYLAVFDLCDLPREAANFEPMSDDALGEKSLLGWTPMSVYYQPPERQKVNFGLNETYTDD